MLVARVHVGEAKVEGEMLLVLQLKNGGVDPALRSSMLV